MQLEIAERMRCPRAHEATPLIMVAQRTVERELLTGVAGCMSCHLEASVRDGDVFFPDAPNSAVVSESATPEALDRLVALLGLAEPRGAILLTGRYAALAAAVAAQVDVHVVVLNAESVRGAGVSVVHLSEPVVPFSDNTFRAAALDEDTSMPVLLDTVRALQVGGRLLAALPLERPFGIRELARDATEWVGEREAGPTGVVRITRR
jgi:hypothetical protein